MKTTKFFLLLSLILGSITNSFADWRTPQQALDAVSSMSGNKSATDLDLAYTCTEDGKPMFYVVNRGADKGFVIVNGWLESDNKIIGYTDNGAFDEKNMPEGLRILMDEYVAQIRQIPTAKRRENKSLKATRANIDPMVKVQWSQQAPFNSLITGGYPAGCGPVAYAQIMSYWKYPKNYDSSTYDWDAMIKDPSQTAQLMKDLGKSFGTKYSIKGSATTVSKAQEKIVKDFGYDGGEYFIQRDNFDYDEWEDMLYGELAARRPFLMFARQGMKDVFSGTTEDLGGAHLFVIDGYKDGLYHVNWGWGGAADGYYKLTLENDDWYLSYICSQMAIVNIKPDDGKSETNVPIFAGDVQYWNLCPARMKPYSTWKMKGKYYRTCIADIKYSTYLRFTDIASKEVIYMDFPAYDGGTYKNVSISPFFACDLKTNVKYLMEPCYKLEGSDEYVAIKMPEKYRNYIVEVTKQDFDESDLEAEYHKVNLYENYFSQTCSYSVRAHISVEEANENYPDRILCINYNVYDDYVENYKNIGSWGTPTYFFNRIMDKSPSAMTDKANETSVGKVVINSLTPDDSYKKITVDATARFNFTNKVNDYRFCYVLLEDSVAVSQRNPLVGSEYYKDTKWYTDEWKVLYLDDYARGIYPDIDGEMGSLPTEIVACTDYNHKYTFSIPTGIVSYDRLHVAVLLYDAQYGRVINVADMKLPTRKEYFGEPVTVDMKKAGTLLERLGGEAAMDDIMKIYQLNITGPVNAADLQLIRSMAGRASRGVNGVYAETEGSLRILDMIGANIVADGSDNAVLYDGSTVVSSVSDNTLPKSLFAGTRLCNLYLPASMEKVEDEAFAECTDLSIITMGYYVETIGDNVFDGCSSLRDFYCNTPNPPKIGTCGRFTPSYCDLYMETNYLYEKYEMWGQFKLVYWSIGTQKEYFRERYAAYDYEIANVVVTLNAKALSLYEGEETMLYAGASSSKDVYHYFNWKSSDPDIVKVRYVGEGTIIAQKAGVATITATMRDRLISASCVVTVLPAKDVPDVVIKLSKTTVDMLVGETYSVGATVATRYDTDTTLVWTSSDASVAAVDETGKITAIKNGEATITAAVKGTSYKEQLKVVVTSKDVVTITLPKTYNICMDESFALPYEINSSSVNYTPDLVWSTSNTEVATIDSQTGIIKPQKTGTVTISAWSAKDTSTKVSCTLTVLEIPLRANLSLDHSTIYLNPYVEYNDAKRVSHYTKVNKTGEKITLECKSSNNAVFDCYGSGLYSSMLRGHSVGRAYYVVRVKETNETDSVLVVVQEKALEATLKMSCASLDVEVGNTNQLSVTISANRPVDESYIWESSDNTIATVDNDGVVNGVKEGEAKITATLKDTEIKTSCTVVVSAKPEPLPKVDLIEKEVNLFFPGTLSQMIGDQTWIIYSLIAKGSLNALDLQQIRLMAGRKVRGFDGTFAATEGQLLKLDMSNAKIVKQGSEQVVLYFSMFPSKVYDNYLPSYFFYQTNIQEVLLPATLEEMGNEVFAECEDLEKIVMGANVTSLGSAVFSGCKNLNTIYCFAKVPPTLVDLYNFDASKCILYVPRTSVDVYKKDELWKNFDIRPIEDAPDYNAYKTYTPLSMISVDGKEIIGIYDINGRQLASPHHGVNIIRYSDGSAQKMIVK